MLHGYEPFLKKTFVDRNDAYINEVNAFKNEGWSSPERPISRQQRHAKCADELFVNKLGYIHDLCERMDPEENAYQLIMFVYPNTFGKVFTTQPVQTFGSYIIDDLGTFSNTDFNLKGFHSVEACFRIYDK